jgi:hypothetical protein
MSGKIIKELPGFVSSGTPRAGFNPVWKQMVVTSSTCYDVVTFLTQWGKSVSNFVAISSLVVKLLKNCRVL